MALTPYLNGKHLSSIQISGLNVDGSGNMTVAGLTNIRAFVASVDGDAERDTEDIRPIWSRQKNLVITGEGHGLVLRCLARSDAAQVLRQIFGLFDYARVPWVQGAESYQGDYVVTGLRYGVTSRGANIYELRLGPCDNGTGTQVTSTP